MGQAQVWKNDRGNAALRGAPHYTGECAVPHMYNRVRPTLVAAHRAPGSLLLDYLERKSWLALHGADYDL